MGQINLVDDGKKLKIGFESDVKDRKGLSLYTLCISVDVSAQKTNTVRVQSTNINPPSQAPIDLETS